jgi:hypothetical protein
MNDIPPYTRDDIDLHDRAAWDFRCDVSQLAAAVTCDGDGRMCLSMNASS